MEIAIFDDKYYVYEKSKLEAITAFDDKFKNSLRQISKKEKYLKAKRMIMINSKDKSVIATYPIIRSQHFYPLSIVDFAYSIKDLVCNKIDSCQSYPLILTTIIFVILIVKIVWLLIRETGLRKNLVL